MGNRPKQTKSRGLKLGDKERWRNNKGRVKKPNMWGLWQESNLFEMLGKKLLPKTYEYFVVSIALLCTTFNNTLAERETDWRSG